MIEHRLSRQNVKLFLREPLARNTKTNMKTQEPNRRTSSVSATLNTAVIAPIPSAEITAATAKNPRLRRK
jgi:hypothetical protein